MAASILCRHGRPGHSSLRSSSLPRRTSQIHRTTDAARPTVHILAVYIVEALRDFVTRPPFEQEKFDCRALFLFHVHQHFSVPGV
jgi:hypothetical protein